MGRRLPEIGVLCIGNVSESVTHLYPQHMLPGVSYIVYLGVSQVKVTRQVTKAYKNNSHMGFFQEFTS